ncbi:MAG: STAS domain-containing protein [Alkalispirochaetaceae bacterium]
MTSVKKSGKKKILIEGELTLEELEGVREKLLGANLAGDETIDLSAVERFDLPGLQLLYALNRGQHRFEFGGNGARFGRMARFAGFTPLPGSDIEKESNSDE